MRSFQGVILAVVCLLPIAAAAQSDAPPPSLAVPPSPAPGPVASVASGDPTSNSLHEGVWGLAFQIPTRDSAWLGGSIGAWYMATPRVNLGLNLALNIDPEQSAATVTTDNGQVVDETFVNVTFVIAPAVKYYFTTSGPVIPYVVGQLRAGVYHTNTGTTNSGSSSAGLLSLAGGFGIEVFPWRFLSFGGTVGLNLDLVRPQVGQRSAALQTLTSALYATVYFQ